MDHHLLHQHWKRKPKVSFHARDTRWSSKTSFRLLKMLQVFKLGIEKLAILIVLISRIFRLAYERSNFALSSLLQKLASKLVRVGACGGAYGGACGGTQVQDVPPHFKSLDLIRLGARGSSKVIGNQTTMSLPKFTENMQAQLFWGFCRALGVRQNSIFFGQNGVWFSILEV